jgi:hypothetical protein
MPPERLGDTDSFFAAIRRPGRKEQIMAMSSSDQAAAIEYRVFTARRPGLTPGVPPGYESLLWVANSATLIYGKQDAVLVDTFVTIDQSSSSPTRSRQPART